MSSVRTSAEPAGPAAPMFDRETSWIAFNGRVLEEAHDRRTPLLERVRFLSIFHTNLDEFFMIRVSGIKHQLDAGLEVLSHQGLSPRQRLGQIRDEVVRSLDAANTCLSRLLDDLRAEGIRLYRYAELDRKTRARWDGIYRAKVLPILTPLAISPAFPFPFVSSLSLNLAVFVTSPDGERRLVRLKVPDHLPRMVILDEDEKRLPLRLMPIEEVISANLQTLFPGMSVGEPYVFRVTRDADMEIREDEADDLLKFIEGELRKRRFGDAVRLEVSANAPDDLVQELQEGLEVGESETFRMHTLIDPSGLSRLLELDLPQHKFPPYAPRIPPGLDGENMFTRIAAGDVLLHHPFDSFSPVAEFVRQAARDPAVLAIKQTLYRTSGNSPVIQALLEAVEAGKQVAAVVELKARFDERNNIDWARRLEEAGVHVIYGVPGYKIHAKLSLVVRREAGALRRYAHIGTGNYNHVTARIYTDLGLFTCDPDITNDLADLFNRITGFGQPEGYRKALVAPRFVKRKLLDLLAFEVGQADAGRAASVVFKCNAITEPDVVRALYAASQAGVQIDLLVRGICGVVPGVPGLSENIRVRSVIGRFLEHSRVFWFNHAGRHRVFIGSADLMGRNLNRRIEVLVPIEDKNLARWLHEEYLRSYLEDTQRTRVLRPDGSYHRLRDLHPDGRDVHAYWLEQTHGP
jgi:polyphosphate kinase